ncbi:TLD domain-containing protein 1 [Bienertia sinuspersici]
MPYSPVWLWERAYFILFDYGAGWQASECDLALYQPHTEPETSGSMAVETSSAKECNSHLLTCGRAWAVSLTQRSNISEEILRICFPSNVDVIEDNLLYRSNVHGKGMNRFWSNVEGYHGPMLLLISATSGESSETSRKWILGALTQQGFENKDIFYGSGGCLYSMFPAFNIFSASGIEKNYLYSHLHPAGKGYDPHPKPVGIAFGGTIGHERIFIEDDFAKVTIRHHTIDKTYQHGSLFPNQGYLTVEASVLDVEVWGLGGKRAKETQISHRKREELFTEQRRKVDMKTFASWEDSPEKLMMDMMSNPNTVRREDR